MKIRELAEYCSSIEIDCDKCENKAQCEEMENITKEKYFMSVIVKLRKKLFLLRHFVLLKTEYLNYPN